MPPSRAAIVPLLPWQPRLAGLRNGFAGAGGRSPLRPPGRNAIAFGRSGNESVFFFAKTVEFDERRRTC